jgi:peptidoglycan/xylan/chitin deacetylase (PgdA/CDA1 family)
MPLPRRRTAEPLATVLLYHAVADCSPAEDPDHLAVSPRAFERQIAALARRRDVVDLGTAVSNHAPKRHVAVTFDDGFANVLHNAVPILAAFGIRATMFVSSGLLEPREAPAGDSEPLRRLTVDELRELAEHVDIGSHGHDHIDLSRATRQQVEEDLTRSRDILGEILGEPPEFLAWPFGRSSREAREVAEEVGFTAAFSTERYAAGSLARERVAVYPHDGDAMFRFKSSGLYGPVRRSWLATRAEPVLSRLSTTRRRR